MKLLLTIFKGKGDFPTITCGICDLVEEMSVEYGYRSFSSGGIQLNQRFI